MNAGRPRPNLNQIAAALDVSVATVSNALSGKGRVSEALAGRIRNTARELGYRPSRTARALSTGRAQVLGLVLPDISNPLFPQIARAIENAASEAGHGVLIADARGTIAGQTEAISHLMELGVDGVVIVPRYSTRITDIGCPFAVIDSPSTPGNTVSADHWQGGELVADHLLSLGHRRFLLIGNNPGSVVQNDRIGGLRSRLGMAGAQMDILWLEDHARGHGETAPLGLPSLVGQGITAFAAVSDLIALRVLTELQRAGIRVPEEASLTGFDDLSFSSVIAPGITTARTDMKAVAERAIAALLRTIDEDAAGATSAPSPARAEHPRVPMTLVIRQTTAPARIEAKKTPQQGEPT